MPEENLVVQETQDGVSLLMRFKRDDYRCPDCKGVLLMGPEGGCAVNVRCEACNHEFNVGVAFGEVFSIERIRWSGPVDE